MSDLKELFQVNVPAQRRATLADGVVLLSLAVAFYGGLTLANRFFTGSAETGQISLSPGALPVYTLYSMGRMLIAYLLSLAFTLVYGRMAAYDRQAEKVLMPLLDVLQSVPILSFLPVVLISLSAVMPQRFAAELTSVVLIFTSQAWNMTFAWYQSLTTIPKELREASAIFRLTPWMRFKTMELPFGAISLIWNSMMSWAGGWFFLMAAEIFTVGQESFRLPGLGAYLQAAAYQDNLPAIGWGLATLVLVIVVMDQWIWRPLLAWADRFKLEMVESDNPPTSWFYDLLRNASLVGWFQRRIASPLVERFDGWLIQRYPAADEPAAQSQRKGAGLSIFMLLGAGLLLFGGYRAFAWMATLPASAWMDIAWGLLATTARMLISLVVALAWTIPVGYAIGSNPRTAAWLQPIVQVVASLPATALFPVLVAALAALAGGLNLAAVLLMLMGTQWYLLFNIIAGAAAVPQDLKYTTALLGIKGWERWKTMILPSLFPFIITGAITASGGAWNASIVAEYIQFGGKTMQVSGIGAIIASATHNGDYPLLLASTLTMILAVALINRLLWRRLYRVAEERFRME
ncbi:MAG: ABC transporter permease subunit [Anaerolineales bacterium]|jgi:NitT/TauT family transport system permease protein|nr:ABC transporter permease subunit [Anaerolineales bacterium]MDX9937264.1 ABC transporter permease subunit [Anaerolineales bacterium]GER80491.1 ABC transporter permease subunit [Candidatus Denitrolinea symbiosum]